MAKEDFVKWQENVPANIRNDPLWKAEYYRLALYLFDLVWQDMEALQNDLRGREIVRQLTRSAGSIAANIEEAYGRGIETADGQRVLRIAIGECRETRGWYFRLRHLLDPDIMEHRLSLTSHLLAMLLRVRSSYYRRHR